MKKYKFELCIINRQKQIIDKWYLPEGEDEPLIEKNNRFIVLYRGKDWILFTEDGKIPLWLWSMKKEIPEEVKEYIEVAKIR